MSSSSAKICFNSDCKDLIKSDRSRKGWRLRTGEFSELCDRCASAFEDGRFCETFHLSASGWRSCESCGKRVHCGCIVSTHAFVLLDAGGIECLGCGSKHLFLSPNPVWPHSLFLPVPLPERLKDLSVKNWSQITASGPVGPWRQSAPTLFNNNNTTQSDLHPNGIDRLLARQRERKQIEDLSDRLMNGSLKLGSSEVESKIAGGVKCEEQPSPSVPTPQQSILKDDPSKPLIGLVAPYSSATESNGQTRVSTLKQPTPPSPMAKQFYGSTAHNGVESSGETQARNGRPRVDARGRNQLLPRYWPRITDQELQQISGDSNSKIIPLFEKMLSASDAGRIGRLVLPKKCAEAYFPQISQPEGLPLKIQDARGKEWIFQFRFWPNNNSRMYVLEGVTPCIHSMQLQAGDTVTFSRLEPEGKLVMGFRKASNPPLSDQGNQPTKTSNGASKPGDGNTKKVKPTEAVAANLADGATTCSKVDKSGYVAKEVEGAKLSFSSKRKNSTLGSKSKRLRIENEDLLELKLTWEEAQGLLRPPPNHVPSVVVIEGFEFEEYEDSPVLGKPTILATDHVGEKVQWAQCEDCCKWRKLPADALLSSRWTCPKNSWDPERSSCSAPQELTAEQLEDLVSTKSPATSKKMKAAKEDPDTVEALEGLDTLANLAILGEGEALPSSSQTTTKHPRHRPGCSCIVCIQPPSGKGPKHKPTCTCNVCLTVKRRFQTLMLRREKKQSEKEAETARKKQFPEKTMDDDDPPSQNSPNKNNEEDPSRKKSLTTPFKGQIDLNIQPEREEELSPGSDSGSMMRLLQDATERCLKQQTGNRNSTDDLTDPGGIDPGQKLVHQDADVDKTVVLAISASASTSATG